MADQTEAASAPPAGDARAEAPEISPDIATLISFASALLDTDRLVVAAALARGSANRMDLAEATGLSHRDLLRHLDSLQQSEIVRLKAPAPRNPDQYSPYELNLDTFRSARQAVGKFRGVKPRPTDARLMTLETFMPGGKLTAFPKKNEQILVLLDEISNRFEPEKQYTEREVNVILEDINEDYATTRRMLVDYGYLIRSANGAVYTKRA